MKVNITGVDCGISGYRILGLGGGHDEQEAPAAGPVNEGICEEVRTSTPKELRLTLAIRVSSLMCSWGDRDRAKEKGLVQAMLLVQWLPSCHVHFFSGLCSGQ